MCLGGCSAFRQFFNQLLHDEGIANDETQDTWPLRCSSLMHDFATSTP
jgi:hypothetical protein